ncbi:MAG: diguanylate cyclase [Bacillota bacterium]
MSTPLNTMLGQGGPAFSRSVWRHAESLLRDYKVAGFVLAVFVLVACLTPYRVAMLLGGLSVLVGCVYDGLRGGLVFAAIMTLGVNSYTMLQYRKPFGSPIWDALVLAVFAIVLGSFVQNSREREKVARLDPQPYDMMVNLMQEGLIVADLNENIMFANDAFAQMLGYAPGALNGKNLSELTTPEQFEVYKEKTKQRREGRSDRYEAKMLRKDGSTIELLVSGTPFTASDGTVRGVIALFWDITDRKREEEKLKYLSLHDSLTGVHNRAHFEQEMERMDSQHYLPVSMIVCDVDHLKKVNDAHGHAAGDEALVRAAAIIKNAVRTSDVVARIGGDEFAVILPNTDTEAARRICERIRQRVEADSYLRTGLSIGTATRENMAASMAELFRNADEAMYTQKPVRAHAK